MNRKQRRLALARGKNAGAAPARDPGRVACLNLLGLVCHDLFSVSKKAAPA